ncbi:MAG: CopG family antitoxin [Acidobacteriaceae bacterium]
MPRELKPIPKFATEAEDRAFWESHNSTDYIDWSHARATSFPNLRRAPQSNPGEPTPTPQ